MPKTRATFIDLAGVARYVRDSMQPFAVERFLSSYLTVFSSLYAVMPRFFIDYEDGPECLQDEEGADYADVHAARDAAIAALPDIGREPPPADGRRAFRAYVRDEGGTVLCTVSLNLVAEYRLERADTHSNHVD